MPSLHFASILVTLTWNGMVRPTDTSPHSGDAATYARSLHPGERHARPLLRLGATRGDDGRDRCRRTRRDNRGRSVPLSVKLSRLPEGQFSFGRSCNIEESNRIFLLHTYTNKNIPTTPAPAVPKPTSAFRPSSCFFHRNVNLDFVRYGVRSGFVFVVVCSVSLLVSSSLD